MLRRRIHAKSVTYNAKQMRNARTVSKYVQCALKTLTHREHSRCIAVGENKKQSERAVRTSNNK
uniref:Uncharacterized protein n=1 Tax=Anopheles minimus TaxID=112268 RepID=A0A182WQ66_9DIPT